ncbi:MAG: hypothetical protein EAZ97_11825 [Bacteroidetes bacterium]|nr:MAG: hypothetical protein EAZ97_11825 [Bacteroidota bacterium]
MPIMIEPEDLEDIIQNIKDEKCLLFVGPQVGLLDGEKPLQKIVKLLGEEYKREVEYHEEEQLFFFREKKIKSKFYRKIKKIYEEQTIQNIHEQITEIPFDVVISIAPDMLLKQTYDIYLGEQSYTYEYYNYKFNPNNFAKPHKDTPLLYHLFGSMQDVDSLIYSHDDQLDFLFALLGDYKLPLQLRNELEEAYNFIFLGCNFDMWYMRIILRMFKLHEDRFITYASNKEDSMQGHLKTFYINQFKVNFVEHDIAGFVDELHKACKKENLLRQPHSDSKTSPKRNLLMAVGKGQIGEAIEKLMAYFQQISDNEKYTEAIFLSSRWTDLQNNIKNGTISEENRQLLKSQITQALLALINLL